MQRKTAIITGAGAADGIGFACARSLAEEGFHVHLVATSERIFARAEELRAAAEVAREIASGAKPKKKR